MNSLEFIGRSKSILFLKLKIEFQGNILILNIVR